MNSICEISNIDREIEFYEQRIEDLNNEARSLRNLVHKYSMPKLIGAIQYSDMPTGSRKDIDFADICGRIIEIETQIYDLQQIIDIKKSSKNKVLNTINNFKGIKYKVAYLRLSERKSIKEIAEELGYSEAYIKKLSRQIIRNLQR